MRIRETAFFISGFPDSEKAFTPSIAEFFILDVLTGIPRRDAVSISIKDAASAENPSRISGRAISTAVVFIIFSLQESVPRESVAEQRNTEKIFGDLPPEKSIIIPMNFCPSCAPCINAQRRQKKI